LIETKNDPVWTAELDQLKQLAHILWTLGIETSTDMFGLREEYGPFLPLLPESQVKSLFAIVRTLLYDDLPEDIAALITIKQQLVSELATAFEDLRSLVPVEDSRFLRSLKSDLADVAAREILSDTAVFLQASAAAQEVLSNAAAVSQAKIAQQETAGEVAESELAKEFAAYGNRQEQRGFLWLGGAIMLFASTVAIALTVLKQVGQSFDWYSLAAHLLIALPCLGFGAYCARESSRHRELAQWARRLAVQLKSVGAFTARLDDDSRLTLLAQFGSYVFGPHQPGKDDNQVQPVPPEIWKAVADLIRSRGNAGA
jgi:hypothetical protein